MKILLIALAVLASFGLYLNKSKKDEEAEGNIFTVEIGSFGHKAAISSFAVPFGKDEEAVLWTGELEIEFSYQDEGQDKHHRMKLNKVVAREKRRMFLEGVDLETDEDDSAPKWLIATNIKPAGDEWQKDYEFLKSLGIHAEQHDLWESYAQTNLEWESSLLTLWSSHKPVEIECTYQKDGNEADGTEELRTVELSLIRQHAVNGHLYFSGSYKSSGVECTFDETAIANRISYAGNEYSIEEFITTKLGADLAAA